MIKLTDRFKNAVRKGFAEMGHAYMAMFVEPLEERYPRPITFFRPDNNQDWKKDRKPLGYWLGHLYGLLALGGFIVAGLVVLGIAFGVWDKP